MRWIVGMSLQFRLLVITGAAGMVLFGFVQLRGMPVDVLPEFAPPAVEVQTEALGLSAEEVEQLITVPLEQDLLNGVPWLAEIRSESLPGLSSVVMTFDPGTDPLRARQVVGERLTQAFALPHVSKPPTMLQPVSSTSRVMMIGLTPKEVSLIDLSVLARWTVAPRLMGVPGVANVAVWGFRDRQLQVQVNPQTLRDKNVSHLQILETTRQRDVGVVPELRRSIHPRHGRIHRNQQSAPRNSACVSHLLARGSGEGARRGCANPAPR